MAEEKPHAIKIELPEGTVEAKGSDRFLAQVRAALVSVLTGQTAVAAAETPSGTAPPAMAPAAPFGPPRLPNIRDLYAEKRPVSDTQTAALIAYYLSEVAPELERSDTVDTDLLVRYFKLCPRELPRHKRQVLQNAKRDGYLEPTTERGKFKLSAIGYNLVVHGLPAGPAAEGNRGRSARRTRGVKKKAARRKAR